MDVRTVVRGRVAKKCDNETALMGSTLRDLAIDIHSYFA